MSNKKRIYLILIIFIISFIVFIMKFYKKTIEKLEMPKIGQIALYTYENNIYKLYNVENEKILEVDFLGIRVYGKYNETTIYSKDDNNEKFYYNKDGEEREFPKFNGELIANNDKTKILYKKIDQNGSMELYYFDFILGKEHKVNTNIYFSGNNIAWTDEDTILIYGIKNLSEDKKENGIYAYNTKDSSERLILPIKIGFIQYLKFENNIIYYVLSEGNKACLNTYDLNTEEKNEVLNVFRTINYIEIDGDNIYIIGNLGGEPSKLYKYNKSTNRLKQLTYDFPKNIDLKNNMVFDSNRNILFIGYDNVSSEKDIYVKERDTNTIKIISDKSDNYNFVKR